MTGFLFYCVRKGCLNLPFQRVVIRLFKILKMCYALKGFCKAEPNGRLSVFSFYFVRKGCLNVSFHKRYSAFSKSRKCFTPPKDSEIQNPMGSTCQTFHFIVFEKWFLRFQISYSPSAFLKSWKIFHLRRSNCFYLYFIPRRDMQCITNRGSIIFI